MRNIKPSFLVPRPNDFQYKIEYNLQRFFLEEIIYCVYCKMQVDLVTKTDKLDSDEEKLGQEEYHTYEDVEYESFEDR